MNHRINRDNKGITNIEFIPNQHAEIHEMLNDKDISEIPQEVKDRMLVLLFKKVFGK